MGVALPAIIVWGLGIPFFALIMMVKEKNSIHTVETRQKYGFLFRGYKMRYYFWEIIIMYRKILLIFIATFFA